ncbi:hypothetical protein ABH927_002683 [Planotetraspora sp. GP83]
MMRVRHMRRGLIIVIMHRFPGSRSHLRLFLS